MALGQHFIKMSTTCKRIATSLLGWWILTWTTGHSSGAGSYRTKADCEAAGRQAAKVQEDLNARIEADELANPDSSSWEGGTLSWKCHEQKEAKKQPNDHGSGAQGD